MIRILAFSKTGELKENLTLDELENIRSTLAWHWIDFNQPTHEEALELHKLGFHELAIQDCIHLLQRTKLDDYDDYLFFVLNTLNDQKLQPQEIDIFHHRQYVVTFHYEQQSVVDIVWERMKTLPKNQALGTNFITYKLIDKVVDSFFPLADQLEDHLTALELKPLGQTQHLMNILFQIRRNLLTLRHVVWPLRDLIFRIIQSNHLSSSGEERRYYMDIHDYLLKLSSMIESSREMTTDIRDNYMSINSNRMNSIMMTLTLITVIFMPLTFIVGVYGMNFDNMPETRWKYGYFMVLGLMAVLSLAMFWWFKRKGWFSEK